MSTPARKGIYGTEFNKPISQIVTDIRSDLTKLRGRLGDVMSQEPIWKDRLDSAEGLMTCGISFLYHQIEEIAKCEIRWEDEKRGKSLLFSPRGIGLDVCPGCFISGGETTMMHNIAAFVGSKEEGEEIVRWFGGLARLDFRPSEPGWIQVKVGTCDEYLPALQALQARTSVYSRIREIDVVEIRKEFTGVLQS